MALPWDKRQTNIISTELICSIYCRELFVRASPIRRSPRETSSEFPRGHLPHIITWQRSRRRRRMLEGRNDTAPICIHKSLMSLLRSSSQANKAPYRLYYRYAGKVKDRLCERAPEARERARRRDSRNLAFIFSCISVFMYHICIGKKIKYLNLGSLHVSL